MTFQERIRRYREMDEETVCQYVPNAAAEAFLLDQFPRLRCPDEDIEETFAFRCWTLRKHIKETEDGFVFTEFLPPVPWAGKHNTINAALNMHLSEAKWMKDSRFGTEYLLFFLNEKGSSYSYSVPAVWEMASFLHCTGQERLLLSMLPKLEHYLSRFEQRHQLPNGLFWSIPGPDAMEYSISGNTADYTEIKGIRPTLNSTMYGGYVTLARLFEKAGNRAKSEEYREKANILFEKFTKTCWDGDFYKAIHPSESRLGAEDVSFADIPGYMNAKELIGYTPFQFGLYHKGQERCFEALLDDNTFQTFYGLTTADKSHERYLYEFDHECLWNGYIWPYATSQTLTALCNVLEKEGTAGGMGWKEYYQLVLQYARMHRLTENGVTKCWIDEVMDPRNGQWYAREKNKQLGWLPQYGGYERGKDYNHSTFLDLVLRGIIGIDTSADTLTVHPHVEGIWKWFTLENLTFRGRTYAISYREETGLTVKEQ